MGGACRRLCLCPLALLQERLHIEAAALQEQALVVPDLVPKPLLYDPDMVDTVPLSCMHAS